MANLVNAGDFNGDGHDDLLVRKSSGQASLYPGDGGAWWGTPIDLGTAWPASLYVG